MKRVHSIQRCTTRCPSPCLGGIALAGCGGGAETTAEPADDRADGGTDLYVGPPPATADIQAFRIEFWENIRATNRCGNCHNAGGQSPNFARSDDVNAAYQQATSRREPRQPLPVPARRRRSAAATTAGSRTRARAPDSHALDHRLGRRHRDWRHVRSSSIAPTPRDPGSSRRFPATRSRRVHRRPQPAGRSTARVAIGPLSDGAVAVLRCRDDIDEAYLAAIPKINLDDPAASRFVIRLRPRVVTTAGRNCAANAATMQAAIEAMAGAIPVTQVDPRPRRQQGAHLVRRHGRERRQPLREQPDRALRVQDRPGLDGIRHERCRSGGGSAALGRARRLDWVGGWGINSRRRMAKAQASTTASRKFHQLIAATGEYSIEAWVVPGNVTQEDARIVSYSGSNDRRNFTMGQTLYNYDFFNRSTATGTNGTPRLSTDDDDERLAGFVAARRHDVRSGQRPSHLRERRVHRRPGPRRRRHARRVGQQLRVRARQRGRAATVRGRA